MSDNFYRATMAIVYASWFYGTLYICGNFLDDMKANSVSQRRAAWVSVYWVRRNQLMVEKDWQEKWEALHAEDYCRQKLQERLTDDNQAGKRR